MSPFRRLRFALLAVLIVPLVALGACGDDNDDDGGSAQTQSTTTATQNNGSQGGGLGLQAVANAADAARDAKSVRIRMKGEVGAAGQTVPLEGEGAFDYKKNIGTLTFDTEVPGAGATKIEEIIDGTVIYIKADALTKSIPGAKEYLKLDLSKLGEQSGIDISALQNFGGSQDPSQFLEYLRGAGNVEEVGKEDIDGVATTRYKATIDFKKLAADGDTPEAVKKALDQLTKTANVDTIPVEVWIDDKGLPRRQKLEYTAEVGGQKATTKFQIDYLEYGAPVEVDVPADSETSDFADLLKSAGGATP